MSGAAEGVAYEARDVAQAAGLDFVCAAGDEDVRWGASGGAVGGDFGDGAAVDGGGGGVAALGGDGDGEGDS